jgi:hypothetical protein
VDIDSNLFDKTALKIKPLRERENNLDLGSILPLKPISPDQVSNAMQQVGSHIVQSRQRNAPTILMMGAHVIRSGVQRYIIDLMERGYIQCLSMNGSGIIHDYEFAKIGATTESVEKYIKTGEFGLWDETGHLNDIINNSYSENKSSGLGQSIGRAILREKLPHQNISLLALASKLDIPATVHVGIGYDIIHQHPNCSGASTGALSYNDFLRFARVIQSLEGGVVMNFGSSIMAPEVFLKALSMARNVAIQTGRLISDFSTLVCDLHNLPENFTKEPSRDSAAYFFRPWKTMLVRTVADGGKSFYVKGQHRETIPALWTAINNAE